MTRLFTVRGVCVEPPRIALQHKKVAGLTVLATKELQPLKALFASEVPFFGSFVDVSPGDAVLVPAEYLASQRWSKEAYEFDGKSFIVVPYEVILGVVSDVVTDPG